jgi:hypothetical protein
MTDHLQPLVAQAPGGDLEAFGRLVDRFRDMVYGYAYALLGDFESAADATQEAFVQAYRGPADLDALRHAVALGRDELAMPAGYLTGQRAYPLWARMLRDLEHRGEARWHANVVLHLGINRRSAVAYLRAMAERHSQPMAALLEKAA